MKKNIVAISLALFLVFSLTGFASAAQTIDKDNKDITDSTGGGSGITGIGLSPNVSISYLGAADAYEMCSFNSSGTMQYGVFSNDSRIFQQAATALTTLTTTDGTTVSGWTAMGGGS